MSIEADDGNTGPRTKVQDLRQMIGLAIKLRASAAGAKDVEEIGLLLRAAQMLEARTERLAYGAPDGGVPERLRTRSTFYAEPARQERFAGLARRQRAAGPSF
jgi:hypothetical protein